MTMRRCQRYRSAREAALLCSRNALGRAAQLTPFAPSDIVRSSSLGLRQLARIAHEHSAAHLAVPTLRFKSQAPR
jgi:hypothetical protein